MKNLFVLVVLTIVMLGTTQSSYADTFVFIQSLSGPAEAPPNASPGTGTSTITYDSTAHTLRVQVTFSGLLANTTAAHIHSATAVPGAGTGQCRGSAFHGHDPGKGLPQHSLDPRLGLSRYSFRRSPETQG